LGSSRYLPSTAGTTINSSLWHNTDECRSKQSLVAEIKDKDPNPDSESDSENTDKRQIIDADPTAIVATAAIQP
jgi:hypothetical protein